jgi:hypothetical protein
VAEGSKRTSARLVAKFTEACDTPSTCCNVRSMVRAQAVHVMPVRGKVTARFLFAGVARSTSMIVSQ